MSSSPPITYISMSSKKGVGQAGVCWADVRCGWAERAWAGQSWTGIGWGSPRPDGAGWEPPSLGPEKEIKAHLTTFAVKTHIQRTVLHVHLPDPCPRCRSRPPAETAGTSPRRRRWRRRRAAGGVGTTRCAGTRYRTG